MTYKSFKGRLIGFKPRGRFKELSVTLPKGTLMLQGGIYQRIAQPYEGKVASIDYNVARSELFPDEVGCHLPKHFTRRICRY